MPNISCSVGSCAYNEQGVCDANILKIVGDGAQITEATSCGTYTNREQSSNEVGENIKRGETEAILCEVKTCAYHVREHCSLDGIEVSSLGEVETYRDTDCLSFERK